MQPDPKIARPSKPQPEEEGGSSHARALTRLIEEHNRALHAFLMTRVRDEHEAREVAQEAYVQLLQLDEPGAINFLRAYLFRTAANIAINRARQRRTRDALDQRKVAEPLVDRLTPDRWALAAEDLEVFQRALLELSPKCRRAFVLHRFNEWSQARIARELGIQERMVRHYLMQAGIYCKLRIRGCSPAEAKARVSK